MIAWELEVFPCEHTLTLQSEPKKISDQKLAKCYACDLSTNLWLCLICGNLGCGRKQYDGTGGMLIFVLHLKFKYKRAFLKYKLQLKSKYN